MATPFTITGRMVQGDAHKAQPPSKDPRTKQVKIDSKTGLPVAGQFFVAVAVAKNDAAWPAFKAMIDGEARTSWPQFFGTAAPGLQIGAELPAGCTNPKFANKVIDGDGFDENGQPYSNKEGFAGHWVVKIGSYYAPKVFEWTASGWQETIHTGRQVKTGDYITVSGDCKSNNSDQSPGMYMNLGAIAFEREGPEIKSAATVDPNAAFGSRGPGGAAVPPSQLAAAPAASPPAPAATPPASPTAAPSEPYTGYMDASTPPPPAPAPVGPTMTAKAAGASYESFIKNGWNDAQLREHGYIA